MMRNWALLALLAAGCSDYDIRVFEGTDVWTQNPAAAVDILMVVDDSCSMQPYQDNLSENFAEFISFFVEADVDYHIGVITTDLAASNAGRIRGEIITPATPSAETVFSNVVNVGVEGSAIEMGLEAAYKAVNEPLRSSANAGFLRDDASLSVIFVSDEEDSSPRPTFDYVNAFNNVKGQRQRDVFNASSLVVTDPASCGDYGVDFFGSEGRRYVDVAVESGGILGNICEQSFSQIVTDLSLNASRLRDVFFLAGKPNVETLRVFVDDVEIPCGDGTWSYQIADNKGEPTPAIVFTREAIPAVNAQVAARYDYGTADEPFCDGEG